MSIIRPVLLPVTVVVMLCGRHVVVTAQTIVDSHVFTYSVVELKSGDDVALTKIR